MRIIQKHKSEGSCGLETSDDSSSEIQIFYEEDVPGESEFSRFYDKSSADKNELSESSDRDDFENELPMLDRNSKINTETFSSKENYSTRTKKYGAIFAREMNSLCLSQTNDKDCPKKRPEPKNLKDYDTKRSVRKREPCFSGSVKGNRVDSTKESGYNDAEKEIHIGKSYKKPAYSVRPKHIPKKIDINKLLDWTMISSPVDLSLELISAKEELLIVLNKSKMEGNFVHLLVTLFSKIVNYGQRHVVLTLLSLLRDSFFLLKHVPSYMVRLRVVSLKDSEEHMDFCECISIISAEYLTNFPRSFSDIPLDVLVMLVSKLPYNSKLQEKVDLLLNQREELLNKTAQKEPRSNIFVDKYPKCFRDISTCPNSDDIHCKKKPFLRPLKKFGCYDNDEHYLDIQFRLFREDFIATLRDSIQEVIQSIPVVQREHTLKVYTGVRILHANCTDNGLNYRIIFKIASSDKAAWKSGKHFIFGSLLCISKDDFQTMIFATVADSNTENLKAGVLDIHFNEGNLAQKYCMNNDPMTMVETPTYFEAYKYDLDGMKDMKDVPMHNYIVKCKTGVQRPTYLADENDIYYDLSCILNPDIPCSQSLSNVPIMKKSHWPDFQYTFLNKSQMKALMHALTEEFTLIQGPPGTGKTYVGLHIADALLQNQNYWNTEEHKPMLIVCYTNHALDQFLKGLVFFGHTNIIRVGGRGCEELKIFNLKSAIKDGRYLTSTQRIQDAKYAAFKDKEAIANEMQPYVDGLKTLYENMIYGDILYADLLLDILSPCHKENLFKWRNQLHRLKLPLLDVYLGLCKFTKKTNKSKWSSEKKKKTTCDSASCDEITAFITNLDISGKNINPETLSTSVKQRLIPLTDTERKLKIKTNLNIVEISDKEASNIKDPWQLDFKQRWQLYKHWVKVLASSHSDFINKKSTEYEKACETFNGICRHEEELIMIQADVIAMTTTCAAKYRECLNSIKPKIVIVEEAAEVLEAHVITSLSDGLEHLILIGDHKQLKPYPAVYDLAKKYSLEISLFERMINNGKKFTMLNTQHRMRPEIARLLRHVYPQLKNHPSTHECPDILGVEHNILFLNHEHMESDGHIKSKSNLHEAKMVTSFCLYLIKQGYKHTQITILTGYTGQCFLMKSMMHYHKQFDGVRVVSLDNFQGEESDIILLSLVRSNQDEKLGFMKVENRICVALSRARIGLFVIGNFNMFEKGSPLWKKVLSDVRRMDCLKDHLPLCCQNHPEIRYHIKTPKDFASVQDGGCSKPCEFRMDCGHVCKLKCHPINGDHRLIPCKKPCNKTFTCGVGHKCHKKCHFGEECERCQYPITKTLKCSHTHYMKCGDDTETFFCSEKCICLKHCGHYCSRACGEKCSDFNCEEMVLRQLPSCGHEVKAKCYVNLSEIVCSLECKSLLDCLHKCHGTCGRCKQGRLHVKCDFPCNRLLICSHPCKEPCTTECPPCKRVCENRCGHSVCQKKCGNLCAPCIEPCLWKCKHIECHKKCNEICDRLQCDKPCFKTLKCGHQCISLCGELCPTFCRVCDKEKVEEVFFGTEDVLDARFILLHDCKHIFEVSALDEWMNSTNDGIIKLKECPKCKTPIRRSFRYTNIIKKVLNDIEHVKEKLLVAKRKAIQIKSKGYEICMEIFSLEMGFENDKEFLCSNGFPKIDELDKEQALSNLLESPVLSILMVAILFSTDNLTDVIRITNQLKIWKAMCTLRSTFQRYKIPNFYRLFSDLENFLVQKLSLQQYDQLLKEFQRLHLHLNTHRIKYDLSKQKKPIDSRRGIDIENLSRFVELFEDGDILSDEELTHIDSKVRKISKQWDLGIYNILEKVMIVKSVGIGKGHWFKCKKGHIYVIGECGGPVEEGTCFECGDVIGGTNHTLVEGNTHAAEFDDSHYPAYSNEASQIRHVKFEDD